MYNFDDGFGTGKPAKYKPKLNGSGTKLVTFFFFLKNFCNHVAERLCETRYVRGLFCCPC